MSNETEDQKWLEALGGKIAGKQATSHLEIEATAIRNSLIRQSQSRPAYEPSERHFQEILAEANKRGLFYQEKTPGGLGIILSAIYEFLTMPAAVMASVTLVLGLSATVGWQAHEMGSSEEMTTRGGGREEHQISRLDENINELEEKIIIFNRNPENLRSLVMEAAIQVQVPIKVSYENGVVKLHLSNILRENENQLTLKAILGMPTEAHGSYIIIFKKK